MGSFHSFLGLFVKPRNVLDRILNSRMNAWTTDRKDQLVSSSLSYQGWTRKLFFSRGGAGQGEARQKIYGTGRGGNPPFPTMRGGAGKGSKSAGWGGAGAGNMLRVSAD